MKGIILAAGKGTRLYPITMCCPKPLLPVYDKPMIYYPLYTLMLAGIKDILIIIPPRDENFRNLLGDGASIGINISYKEQLMPRGIADAFIIGEDFIGDDSVCLILGDNIFFGDELENSLIQGMNFLKGNKNTVLGGLVFGYYVSDPRPFGVIEVSERGEVISIEEKPITPKSNYIVPGLYFYDNSVIEIAKAVKPSPRGELEITSVNNSYIERNALKVAILGENISWFDTGTANSILEASNAVCDYQKFHLEVGNIDLLAYRRGLISQTTLKETGEKLKSTEYGKLLLASIKK